MEVQLELKQLAEDYTNTTDMQVSKEQSLM
jgi:hypothetical protein